MSAGIFDLAVVVLLAAVLGMVAKLLRQPIVLAYLATGAIIAHYGYLNFDQDTFRTFSDLGIMFLLFLAGLEINYTSLRMVGRSVLIIGLGQVIFTLVIGFFLGRLMGFDSVSAAYIGMALTFSSTIIIIKLLSEKKDLGSLYGKISVGALLVQDLVAVVLLVLLAGFSASEDVQWLSVSSAVAKGVVLFILMLFLGRKVLPKIFDRIAKSHELLFLFSLAWVFLLASLVERIGFSIEIAGFLAGLALANSAETFQIAGRVRPLRDFFILIFFVILGSSLVFSDLTDLWGPIAAFSAFVLIGNPLIVFFIMVVMGYRSRTSFLTGLTMAQISEFSLVLAALGLRLGHIDDQAVAIITTVGVITITTSSYFIIHADWLFRLTGRVLKFFERRKLLENGWHDRQFDKPIILIGAHRTGQSIALSLPKEQLLIIDYDPEVVEDLKSAGYEYIFGDISDPEILERGNFASAALVISTSPDFEDNMNLLRVLKKTNPEWPRVVLRADTEKDAESFYRAGADYVILPNFTAGQYFGKTIAVDAELKMLHVLRARDIMMLRDRRRFINS